MMERTSAQYAGPVTVPEMVAILDADEPRSTIVPTHAENVQTRLRAVERDVFDAVLDTSNGFFRYEEIIRSLNHHGFVVCDRASGEGIVV